jgi:hypothetical protein
MSLFLGIELAIRKLVEERDRAHGSPHDAREHARLTALQRIVGRYSNSGNTSLLHCGREIILPGVVPSVQPRM